MKKTYLLLIAVLLFAFNGCDDDDTDPLNYVSFETTDFDFGVELNGSSTNDISIYSTKMSSSDRTYNITVDPSSSADPSSYDIPSSITIPANSNKGTATITVSDINISENGETIVLAFDKTDDLYTGENITLYVRQVCPLNEVVLDIAFDSYPEESAWELLDANDVVISSGGTYPGESSFSKNFCLADGTYTFIMYDAYGDGISPPGGYKLIYNGAIIASGDAFGTEDITTFELKM